MQPFQEQPVSWVLYESDAATEDMAPKAPVPASAENIPFQIVWRNVAYISLSHIGGLYGSYLFLVDAMWLTRLFAVVLYYCSGLGITAGVHRLWAHKAYEARWPLRLMLIIFQTIAFQDAAIDWARDHRMHHKYSETDADPHNATRGFFFSHVGWLLVRKHPQIKAKGHTIDVSDLWADPILRFQKKYYKYLMPLACFILPSIIPKLWGETLWNAFFVCALFRFVFVLNDTWLVNSAAHIWGNNRPYDKHIKPVETKFVSIMALGEGFHNYHHTFPWDYKTAELGNYSLNWTKLFIDTMAKIGWAYNLKSVSDEVIEKRVKRTGDSSHLIWRRDEKNSQDQMNGTVITDSEKNN